MTQFKTGDKAIYHCTPTEKELVDILHVGESQVRCKTIDGLDVFHCDFEELTICYTVRILSDELAREVNPQGKKPIMSSPPYSQTEYGYDSYLGHLEAWREADSCCRSLPWRQHESVPDYYDIIKEHGNTWYAYIENDCFILLKPITK